jgi:hypothetical protein
MVVKKFYFIVPVIFKDLFKAASMKMLINYADFMKATGVLKLSCYRYKRFRKLLMQSHNTI